MARGRTERASLYTHGQSPSLPPAPHGRRGRAQDGGEAKAGELPLRREPPGDLLPDPRCESLTFRADPRGECLLPEARAGRCRGMPWPTLTLSEVGLCNRSSKWIQAESKSPLSK